ncbi:hypothetical protein [Mycobacterium lentiflavum]|nr:hypothetical protein [Mycobacterium lentiflavum]
MLKALLPKLQAAELTRKRERQKSCWPKGVVLEREIYELPSVEEQVQRQNANIESRVSALGELLQEGLQRWSGGFDKRLTGRYRAGNPRDVVAYLEAVLTTMPLPDFIAPKVKVAYTPNSRQLVVEYELPTVDIVPRAKLYRFVKSRDAVTETMRPVTQVKGLYANAIAQLALLCLACIFDSDSERHIEVVVLTAWWTRSTHEADNRFDRASSPCASPVTPSRRLT